MNVFSDDIWRTTAATSPWVTPVRSFKSHGVCILPRSQLTWDIWKLPAIVTCCLN